MGFFVWMDKRIIHNQQRFVVNFHFILLFSFFRRYTINGFWINVGYFCIFIKSKISSFVRRPLFPNALIFDTTNESVYVFNKIHGNGHIYFVMNLYRNCVFKHPYYIIANKKIISATLAGKIIFIVLFIKLCSHSWKSFTKQILI